MQSNDAAVLSGHLELLSSKGMYYIPQHMTNRGLH